MRLYIWHDVLKSYSHGVAFALAETEADARRCILAGFMPHQTKPGAFHEENIAALAVDIAGPADVVAEGPVGYWQPGGD